MGVFALIVVGAQAQKVKIYDINSLKPVNSVYVIEKGNERSSFSSKEGEIELKNFRVSDTLLIQHPSYLTEIKTVAEILKSNNTLYLREKTVDLLEFVVTANKREQKKSEISNQVSRLTARDVEFYAPQTAADLLEYQGDVFVQKSQLGGGSPMIRGFSANKVLIVVDGVRMNNAIFRGGNLQNVINVDPLSLESAEVIYGPSSLIYGSDALGGVMNFRTKEPAFTSTDSMYFASNIAARYSSANSERNVHLDLTFGGKRWAFFTSLSASEFGDLQSGRWRPNKYGDFGLREWTVTRIAGIDSVVANPDPHIMRQSGFQQLSAMQKIRFKANDKLSFNYSLIYSTTSDIPRYDRLIETRDGRPRSAEWYYGPQEWFMNSLELKYSEETMFFDALRITGAWQHFTESRNDRSFGRDWLRKRTEDVDVYSLNVDFDKKLSETSKLFYGLEGSYNNVDSEGERLNLVTGGVQATSSRYPAAGSQVYQASVYGLYERKLSATVSSNVGLRYTIYNLHSDLSDKRFFSFPYEEIDLNTMALTGNAGLVYTPNKKWQYSTNLSSGFRAPNLDDVGKVFDSEPGRVIVPNPDLAPEYAYTGEFAIIRTFGKNSKIQLNSFYTYALNAIVRGDFSFDGQDSILYDGSMSEVQSLVNTATAVIYGFSYNADIFLYRGLGVKSSLTWIDGEDQTNGAALRHVPPIFGFTNLFFQRKNLYTQLGLRYNGGIAFEDLAPDEQSKTHLYTPEGALSWWTLNAKISYEKKTFAVQAGCDNILDRFYWASSSGIAAPGRNIYISLKFKI